MSLRALVLTAGFGMRLRPLTSLRPKPLLPIGGETVAGATLRQLAQFGVEATVLNLHHLADQIPRAYGDSYFGMPLRYQTEETLLGTGGPLFPLRAFLGAADLVLLVNGDSLCRWPLKAIVERHHQSGADATLLLRSRPFDASLGGGIGIDREGFVAQLRDLPASGPCVSRHDFAGLHVLSPHLLDAAPEGPGDILEGLYQPLLRRGGRIATLKTGLLWHDLGNPRRYLEGVLAWQKQRRTHYPAISPLATVEPGADLHLTVVEPGAQIAPGARVHQSIVFADAQVGPNSHLDRVIVAPATTLPPGAKLSRVLALPKAANFPLGPGDRHEGDLHLCRISFS